MDLNEIITKTHRFASDARTVFDANEPLSAYDYIDELYDFLTEEFLPCDISECESAESSNGS